MIELDGSGRGLCEVVDHDPKKDVDQVLDRKELAFSQEAFAALLSAFYLQGFLALQEQYDSGDDIQVDPSGRVLVTKWQRFDAVCRATTLEIGTYEKRVWNCAGERGPAALRRLESEILRFNDCKIPSGMTEARPAN